MEKFQNCNSFQVEYNSWHFSSFILNRFQNFSKSILILFAVIKFIDMLLRNIKWNKYDNLTKENCRQYTGISTFILSPRICCLLFDNFETNEISLDIHRHASWFVIEKSHYNLAVLTLLKEVKSLTHPGLISSIYPNHPIRPKTH